MVKKFMIVVLISLISLSVQAQPQKAIQKSTVTDTRNGKQFYLHTVTAGQTVYSIARAYEVTVDEIYFENPESKNGISIGQQLWIPVISKENELKEEVSNADFDFFYHIVKRGETLYGIAREYDITQASIRSANPGLTEHLREGQYIKIPTFTGAAKAVKKESETGQQVSVIFDPDIPVIQGFRHEVKQGETTSEIAAKYEVEVNDLKAVNYGLGDIPEPGDRLKIPQEKIKKKKPAYITYKVKKKETLYSISRQYGLTVQDLLDANKGLTMDIKTGQVIRIPEKVVTDKYLTFHVPSNTKVKKVAKLYGIPVYEITEANPDITKKVYAGEKLKIPVGDKAITSIDEETAVETEKEIVTPNETHGDLLGRDCRNIAKADKKHVFKIALMIPLYLEETDSLDVSKFLRSAHDYFTPFRFIRFYEGALLAVDSLQKQGMQVEVFVFDVDQSITKAAKALQHNELKNMDLIIGPFFSRSFDQVALFAGNFGIPIVNPLSFRDEILNKYSTVIKVKPGEEYQQQLLQNLLASDYPDARVFLISQSAYKAADKITNLQNAIRESLPHEVQVSNLKLIHTGKEIARRDEDYKEGQPVPPFKIEGREMYPDVLESNPDGTTMFTNNLIKINYSVDSLHPFYRHASAVRKNVVVLYGDNKSFVMDVMNRLNPYRDTFDICLVGVPAWERFEGLNQTLCSNMELTYFASSSADYTENNTQEVVYKFRRNYNTDPGQMGLTGFDVTYYFMHALFYLGKRFDRCLPDYPQKMILNNYHFDKKNKENFENKSWNILRYKQLKLMNITP